MTQPAHDATGQPTQEKAASLAAELDIALSRMSPRAGAMEYSFSRAEWEWIVGALRAIPSAIRHTDLVKRLREWAEASPKIEALITEAADALEGK